LCYYFIIYVKELQGKRQKKTVEREKVEGSKNLNSCSQQAKVNVIEQTVVTRRSIYLIDSELGDFIILLPYFPFPFRYVLNNILNAYMYRFKTKK